MARVTGPIGLDSAVPVGTTTKVSEVDDEIRDFKTKVIQYHEIAHFAFTDTRAGQIKPGECPLLVDTEANILALTADDNREILAWATNTQQFWASIDPGGGYAWTRLINIDPSTMYDRDETTFQESIASGDQNNSVIVVEKSAGVDMEIDLVVPSGGNWMMNLHGRLHVSQVAAGNSVLYAAGFQVVEDADGTPTTYNLWMQHFKHPANFPVQNHTFEMSLRITPASFGAIPALVNGDDYKARLIFLKEAAPGAAIEIGDTDSIGAAGALSSFIEGTVEKFGA